MASCSALLHVGGRRGGTERRANNGLNRTRTQMAFYLPPSPRAGYAGREGLTMVFLLIEPSARQETLDMAKRVGGEVWLGADVITEQQHQDTRRNAISRL